MCIRDSLKTAILSSVPVLTEQYLLQRARSENQDNPISLDNTPPKKVNSQHTASLSTQTIQVDLPSTETNVDADEGEVLLETQNEDDQVNYW